VIPRWWTAAVLALLFFGVGSMAAMAVVEEGPAAQGAAFLAVSFGLVLVAAASALLRRRRPVEPRVTADGTRVFLAPVLTVWPLLGAWFAVLGGAALWGWVALTDLSALESPGASLVMVVGAVGSLPDLVRLLTGRLHRWRLELGPDTLTYRGYRTSLTLPWSKVHGAALHRGRPAGVRLDVKGAGADPVVPITAFAAPAEQLVAEVERAKAAAPRL
jgi:hypothetical protein